MVTSTNSSGSRISRVAHDQRYVRPAASAVDVVLQHHRRVELDAVFAGVVLDPWVDLLDADDGNDEARGCHDSSGLALAVGPRGARMRVHKLEAVLANG